MARCRRAGGLTVRLGEQPRCTIQRRRCESRPIVPLPQRKSTSKAQTSSDDVARYVASGGGCWKFGNAGSEKCNRRYEIERGYASSSHRAFGAVHSGESGNLKKQADRLSGRRRSAALHRLFDPGSVEFDFTRRCTQAKPIFNLIAQKLSFTDYNLSPARIAHRPGVRLHLLAVRQRRAERRRRGGSASRSRMRLKTGMYTRP